MKYQGNVKNIVYRSFLEFKFMRYLDKHPSVTKWSSEELYVPYRDPISGRMRRYFPDNLIEKQSANGDKSIVMIEVKPDKQTRPPKRGKTKKSTKRFLRETATWCVNEAKWTAAKVYCKKRGLKFQIITERDLGIKY